MDLRLGLACGDPARAQDGSGVAIGKNWVTVGRKRPAEEPAGGDRKRSPIAIRACPAWA